jgi:hypothetical protein
MTGIRPAPRPASPPCWMRRILVGVLVVVTSVLMLCFAAVLAMFSRPAGKPTGHRS